MKVSTEIRIYERNDEELSPGSHETLTVCSHWNNNRMIVLVDAKGSQVTVLADQLQRAITNAINH